MFATNKVHSYVTSTANEIRESGYYEPTEMGCL